MCLLYCFSGTYLFWFDYHCTQQDPAFGDNTGRPIHLYLNDLRNKMVVNKDLSCIVMVYT